MTDPLLDEMLRRYLAREEQDPIRERLKHMAEWMAEHEAKDNERHEQLIRGQDGHNFRLSTLEQRAEKVEEKVEDTATHNIESLKKKNERVDTAVFRVFACLIIFLAGVGVYAAVRDMALGHTIQTPVQGK